MPAERALKVPVDGETLHVTVRTEPDARGTLLLVHGFLSQGAEFGEAAAALAARGWTVAVPDLRGHGKSTGPRGYASARVAVRDLRAVLDAVKKDGLPAPLGVVGHSAGSALTMKFLHEAPEVRAAALVAPLSRLLDQVPAVEAAAYRAAIGANKLVTRLGLPSIKVPYKFASRAGYRRLYVDRAAADAAYRAKVLQTTADTAWAEDMLAIDGVAWAREAKQPALFVLCTEDRVLKLAECRKVVGAYAGEKRVVEIGSGHSAFGDVAKGRLVDELDAWFKARLR